jgi:hypothetical protein
MVNSEIILGGYGKLDVGPDTNIPLNFSISEIQNISARQGGYSKAITLPGTPNNRRILGQVFSVNIEDSSFNINLRVPAIINQNGVPIFEGYFQLKNVKKNTKALGNGDQFIQFEALIKDYSGDFFVNGMEERLLQDLDFSELDHTYTLSAITSTSAHTWLDSYTYFLPNRQDALYHLTDFKPAIFALTYWNRIFADAGYTYQWTGMTNTGFDKLIIPYNGEKPVVPLEDVRFRVGYSALTSPAIIFEGVNFIPQIYNDDSSSPNFDTNNLYNTSNGDYITNFIGQEQMNIGFEWKLFLSASTPMQTSFLAFALDIKERAYNDSTFIPLSNPNVLADSLIVNNNISITGTTYDLTGGTYAASYTTPVEIGSLIQHRLEVAQYFFQNGNNWTYLSGGTVPANLRPKLCLQVGNTNDDNINYLFNIPTPEVTEGSPIEMNSYIPKKIKQKDFILGIIRMFNLYIYPNPDNQRELIVQTRDEFYDSGKELDWTNKIDIGSDVKLQFLPDVTNKRLLLSYKQDNDIYNQTYQSATGDIYGQQQYVVANQFVKDEKKIEAIFSPTPLVLNKFNNVVPSIDASAPKNNIRILYYNGWIDGDWTYIQSGGTLTNISSAFVNFNTYPYAGHLAPNPITPDSDFNFGLNDRVFYSTWENQTTNNLYNKYYKRFFSQIETGKLLIGKFNLNEYDIHNLDLRDRIWLHDSWWFINKIVDYNGSAIGGLTTVELINIDEGITFTPQTTDDIVDTTGMIGEIYNEGSYQLPAIDNMFGVQVAQSQVLGFGNGLQDGSVRLRIAGDSNYVGGSDIQLNGNNNTVTGNNLQILGNLNLLTGSTTQSVIQGSGNSIAPQTSNLNIFGSNNNIQFGVTDLSLHNSDNNIIEPFVTGATLINSSNVTIASGVTNVVVLNASNVTITGSNQTYSYSGGSSTGVWEVGSGGFQSIQAANATTTNATGDYAVAEGADTNASGNYSHAQNQNTFATGSNSHAGGFQARATGDTSFTHGAFTLAAGDNSHAEGNTTSAFGNASHAEGTISRALGDNSHAEGTFTIASGIASHAEGSGAQAIGDVSHAEGGSTSATTSFSHAGGAQVSTEHYAEWARSSDSSGKYGVVSLYGLTQSTDTNIELFLDGGTETFDIANGSAYLLSIELIGKKANGSVVFKYDAGIENLAGTTQFINGSSPTLVYSVGAGVNVAPSIVANNTSDKLQIIVNPLASTLIPLVLADTTWFGSIHYTKIN